MIMIILTLHHAETLEQLYLSSEGKTHKPTPVPLVGGEFVLSTDVLTDTLYTQYHPFLLTLPQREVLPQEFINELPGDIQ